MSNGVNKIILGFVGPLASGKGTICQYLKEKHGASVFRFSTMLRDVLNRLYLEISRDNMQNLSSALRQTFGDDLLASVIANDVKNEKNEFIVIDGVRREPDIKYLKDFPNFYLIEIKADQKINWICSVAGRAERGLTSAARSHRMLRGKGRGFERRNNPEKR